MNRFRIITVHKGILTNIVFVYTNKINLVITVMINKRLYQINKVFFVYVITSLQNMDTLLTFINDVLIIGISLMLTFLRKGYVN